MWSYAIINPIFLSNIVRMPVECQHAQLSLSLPFDSEVFYSFSGSQSSRIQYLLFSLVKVVQIRYPEYLSIPDVRMNGSQVLVYF